MRTGRASALTDTGRRRLQNEDAFVCDPPLYAVADGMGGAQAGEIASRLAVSTLEQRDGARRGEETVAELVRAANTRIFQRALDDPALAGMGTTITAMLVDDRAGTIAVAHVGDSRAYLVRDRALEQLTADHSLVAELVRSGRLTPAEAEQHPHRSVITRALGTEAEVEVDTFTVAMQEGDLFLLCSDGLTAMLADSEIVAILAETDGDPDRAADALVGAANRAGGEDNITVVVLEIVPGDPAEAHRSAPASDPDLPTAEQAAPVEPATPGVDSPGTVPVRRHGAGGGGRWLALAAIVLAVAVAGLVIWWSIGR